MEELFNLLVSTMAENMTPDDLAERLEKSIKQYRKEGDFGVIETTCFVVIKRQAQNIAGGAKAENDRFQEFMKFKNAFDHTQNKS